MGSLPVLKPRDVAALFAQLGFQEVRKRGSHRQYWHPDGRGTTVPFHSGRDISRTLPPEIARDIGLAVEECFNVTERGLEAAAAHRLRWPLMIGK